MKRTRRKPIRRELEAATSRRPVVRRINTKPPGEKKRKENA